MSLDTQPAFSRDVTQDQMRAVLEFSTVPTVILQWGKVLYINPAGLALLGSDEAEQVVHESILGFSDPEEREESRRRRLHSLKERGDEVSVTRKNWIRRQGKWKRQDGGTIVLEVKAWSIPLAGGDGTQISFTDVTALRKDQGVREQAEEHTQLAIESAEIGIWDFDPRTSKLRWSKRCNEMFDLPWNGEVDYAQVLRLVHPEDRARTDRAVQESLDPEGTGEFGCDYRILRPDGTVRWIASKGHAFFSNLVGRRTATRLIGTTLDITELRESDASLRQNEKLAVTGRLASSIAHEINNPLEAITNLLYLLDDASLQTEQRKYIKLAQQELARVVDISTQALRFYRDPSAPTQCNLPDIIDSALALFGGRIAAAQIQVERDDYKNAIVLGAREELRQMMVNLVHNAMDAMPHGGRLLVRTKSTTEWHRGRKGIRLTVADTGEGMSRSTMRRMFEPFFTTRPAVGTGLGLWLCAGIVKKHGGKMQVKSCQKPGRSGTVFSIFLPYDRRK
jgi:PAS domain S-box-containing protein